MTYNKFSEIWDNIFLPLYLEFNNNNAFYLKKAAKQRIYNLYQRKKTFLKKNYMADSTTHLDRHKVAACMMYAIIVARPVKMRIGRLWHHFRTGKVISWQYVMSNEYLALLTALAIICSFEQYDKNQNDRNCTITIPNTKNGEDYIYNTCLDLYLARKTKNINVLTFANVFFLLETGLFE